MIYSCVIIHYIIHGRKHFCDYCLHAFNAEEVLKRHIKDCFKINGEQRIIFPRKGEYVKFKNLERKIKSSFMIYKDFESILVPEYNGMQIQTSLILTNINNMLLAVVVIN